MLSLLLRGPSRKLHLSRRTFLRTVLQTGGALSLPNLLRQRAEAGRPRRETAVIQLWLGGGPSQLDMYDLKPAARPEVREPIRTNVPGLDVCELLPRQARLMDRLAVVRSLHHTQHDHKAAVHWVQTGYFAPPSDSLSPTHPAPSHTRRRWGRRKCRQSKSEPD